MKGALFAEFVSKLTLQDLIDVVCLKATMVGADIRIKVTYPQNAKRGKKVRPA